MRIKSVSLVKKTFVTVTVSVVSATLLFMGLASPAQASIKAGDFCKKTGQSKSVKGGRGELVCLQVAGSRIWIFASTTSSKTKAAKTAKSWRTSTPLPNEEILRHFSVNSDAYILERITLAQQVRDERSQQLVVLSNQRAGLDSEIASLPNQVSQALLTYQQAKPAVEDAKKALQRASSDADILYSQYSSAMTGYYANLACEIQLMFGYVGSCGYFDSAGYSSLKNQYEWASAKELSLAKATDAKVNEYNAKYKEYSRLYDRQASAQSELSAANAELAHLDGLLVAAESHLAASHDANGQLQQLRLALSRWDATNSQLLKLAAKKLPKKWNLKYQRMARMSGIAKLHRGNVIEVFTGFRALTTDLPDPPPTPLEPTTSEGPNNEEIDPVGS